MPQYAKQYAEYHDATKSIRSEVSFNLTCIRLFKPLYCLCERRFVRTFDLQKGFSLSEAVNEGSGKEMVWVQKIWRAFAIRAKAHRLDQNQQSLADKEQRSDH
jgi:hypothetical protein